MTREPVHIREDARSAVPPVENCWSVIGIRGDLSCERLHEHLHCANCPVHERAAGLFFDREPPPGYHDEALRKIASPAGPSDPDVIAVLVFRIASEWLGVKGKSAVEVAAGLASRGIPGRANRVLVGLTSLRGRILPLISLEGLLEIAPASDPRNLETRGGFVVIGTGADEWVFRADEIAGVESIRLDELKGAPAASTRKSATLASAVFAFRGHAAGLLDEARLFSAIEERIR